MLGPGAPLFLRILLVMLASVITVQLLNFALIGYVGLPFPRLYAVTQVATALRTGADPDHEIEVAEAAASPIEVEPKAGRIRDALARAIGVPEIRVRVSLALPLQGDSDVPLLGVNRPLRPRAHDLGNAFVMGDFTAAAQLPDGRWRVARATMRELPMMRYHFALLLMVAVLTIAPISWIASRRVARPIALFAAAAERLGRDPRAKPITMRGYAEIKDAARAFNLMQARLNRYVEDRVMLIAAIAHDLRTPLMRLSLRLENAPAALRRASEADIADMVAMIAAATAFVRDMTGAPDRRRLDLRSLVQTVTDDLADRGSPVSFADGEALVMEGEAAALKSLATNLIGNALKYAGDARVSLAREDGYAVLQVRDSGPGIPEQDLDRVFEPFFRGETSRNRDTGGSGLGLASVRAVAHAHGGHVTLTNQRDGGVLATVCLPV